MSDFISSYVLEWGSSIRNAHLTRVRKTWVALLLGKFLQIWKVFATSTLLAEEFTDNLENVWMLYKVSSKYAKCPDELESVWMI